MSIASSLAVFTPRSLLTGILSESISISLNCFVLGMGLLGGRNGACKSVGWMELLFIALAFSQFSDALSQPVIFHYGNIGMAGPYQVQNNLSAVVSELQQDNITCFGDFYLSNPASFSLSLPLPLNESQKQSEQGVDVIGRCLYRNPVQLQQANVVNSFSTMFQVSVNWDASIQDGGCVPWNRATANGTLQGLAFIIANDASTEGDGNGYLGWLNSSTNSTGHNFAVEIDLIQDLQFKDPTGIHLGVDSNSLISVNTSTQPSWQNQSLEWGSLWISVWIEYDGYSQILNIFASDASDEFYNVKPVTPALSSQIDLRGLLSQEDMFVGFSGSLSNVTFSGSFVQETLDQGSWFGYTIFGWSFNSNGEAPDLPRLADGSVNIFLGPDLRKRTQKVIIISVTVPFAVLVIILTFVVFRLHKRNARLMAMAKKYQIEEDLLEQGPQNFKYKTLSVATKGFSSQELLGSGGFGSVYRGRLKGKGAEQPTDVAVKRISATSQQGAREFLAEVKVIGQAQHRNLVRLLGWCHERGELLLVYDFMPNGSVDQHLFKDSEGEPVLTWARRLKIVSGVATALAYLHEEWEQRVIHRDVKSSNVMLDRDFNARLGDFGLARLSEHDQAPQSTAVLAGTFGYLAPELALTLKATEKTDVYAFGAMVLEMATGRRPLLKVEDETTANERLLVDWVWGLYRDDAILEAADCRLQAAYDPGEMVMFLKIGLLCSHPDPGERPSMRAVLNIWKGSSPIPALSRTKPTPVFVSSHSFSDNDMTSGMILDTHDNWHSDTLASDLICHSAPIIPLKVFDDSSQPEIPLEKGNFPSNPGLRYRRYNSTTLPVSLPI